MSIAIFLVIYIIILNSHCLNGEKCQKSDFEFQYTECDITGHRWLVSVPKGNKSCDSTSDFNLSKRARNCGNPCNPGTYLDVENQVCQDCSSGTYSQGDTIEISNWHKMPPGFQTFSADRNNVECNSQKWMAKGDFISASFSGCDSVLSFNASLYKPGELQFEYQMSSESALFEVKVVHDECQSKIDDEDNINTIKYMVPTTESFWNKTIVLLKKGRNVITWLVNGFDSERSVVKMKNLRITNSIYSSECTNCSAGYFSIKGSSVCSPCAMNSFNNHSGSDQCKLCPADKYSMPGSKSCIKKSMCTTGDYSYKWTECNKDKRRKKIYSWIEPKICSETASDAVKLPKDSPDVLCESCPRGTFLNVSSQLCQFCPSGSVAVEAGDKCQKCTPNTKPVSNIVYDKWSHFLPNLTSKCINKFSGECKSEESWLYNGDHLQSSMVSDVHFLRLKFQTNDGASSLASKSSFAFQFSMNCSSHCLLHLFLKRDQFASSKINTWWNSTDRTQFRYDVPLGTSGTFVWFFTRIKDVTSAHKSTNNVKIYSISLSDSKNVGAIECRNCDPKSLSNGCLDCDKGKYFSKDSHKCESCPPEYILIRYPSESINDCERCGEGLLSLDGISCQPKMTYISPSNNVYDLSKLKGHHLLRGNRLFNSNGQEYIHVFNVSLFSDDSGVMSLCRNNISSTKGVLEVASPMCRVTIVADKSQNNTLYSVQTISLADKFQKISQSNTSVDYWKKMNDSLINNGFAGDKTGIDLHVHLFSARKSDICVNGRLTIVTIRCDIKVTEAQYLLPSKCPVETCDGCNFHFLLKSPDACPYCRSEDSHVLTEECVDGHQKRHFQTPSYCILQPGSKSTVDIKCPLVTMRTAIIVIPTACILVFLIGLVIYCYNQNKKLEYKYMRLIGGNDDNENNLEGSESCAMHDGDEDEDEDVKIKTNSQSGEMFARFNKPKRNRRDENGMETVNLHDNPEFDI